MMDEDLTESIIRLHILRFWSRERQVKFCLHLLGDKAQEWWANMESKNRELIEHKQYALELDRQLQTGESHVEIQS